MPLVAMYIGVVTTSTPPSLITQLTPNPLLSPLSGRQWWRQTWCICTRARPRTTIGLTLLLWKRPGRPCPGGGLIWGLPGCLGTAPSGTYTGSPPLHFHHCLCTCHNGGLLVLTEATFGRRTPSNQDHKLHSSLTKLPGSPSTFLFSFQLSGGSAVVWLLILLPS